MRRMPHARLEPLARALAARPARVTRLAPAPPLAPSAARVLRAFLAALATLALAAQGASAYWSNAGQGAGSASLGTLAGPAVTAATAGAETVELSWSAISPPATGTVEYYLTRDGGAPSGNCPTSSSPSTATSCTDAHVAIGSHTYQVRAVWRSWTTAGEERAVSVLFGPATHLQLEAASTTPAAGEADDLTITAKDASNDTVATYSGAHTLLFEGAGEAPSHAKPAVSDEEGVERSFGEATQIAFSEGRALVSGASNGAMRLYRAEAAHIKVSEGALNNGTGLAVTVKAAAATRFTIPTPGEQTAATAITLTLTATDDYGNTNTSYAGAKTLSWSGAANSPSGHAPEYPAAATTVTFTAGVGKASSIKLYDAATTTLTVQEGSAVEGSTGAFAVKAAAAKKFTLAAPSEAFAGSAFAVTLTATDEYGNPAPAYAGAKTLAWSGPANSPGGRAPEYPASATTVTFASGVGTASGIVLYDAVATVTLTVKEASTVKGSASLAVKAASAKTLAFTALAEQTAGTAFNATLTAKDEYGNTAASYAGAKTLSWSGPANSPSGRAPEYPASATSVTFTAGVGKATTIKIFNVGTSTLTVKETSASIEGVSSSFNVKAGAAKRLAWSEARTEPAGRVTSALCLFECTAEGLGSEGKFDFKVSVTDEWGNPQASHGSGSKSVKLTSSCATCSLSASTLTIAEGVASSSEASFTGAANTTWQGTLEASEGSLLKATASLKH